VRLLLEHRGISINARDYETRTPLLKAIEMEHQGIANLLLSKGDVDADARDDYGRSPLSLAAEKGDEALVGYFSSGKTLTLSPRINGTEHHFRGSKVGT